MSNCLQRRVCQKNFIMPVLLINVVWNGGMQRAHWKSPQTTDEYLLITGGIILDTVDEAVRFYTLEVNCLNPAYVIQHVLKKTHSTDVTDGRVHSEYCHAFVLHLMNYHSRSWSQKLTDLMFVPFIQTPSQFPWSFSMKHSKGKLNSNGDKPSQCCRSFWLGNISKKVVDLQGLKAVTKRISLLECDAMQSGTSLLKFQSAQILDTIYSDTRYSPTRLHGVTRPVESGASGCNAPTRNFQNI
jgi:hypothetical protein